jgi:catechol 2,3-dioxygenase-like lactoylglutathione lyase family enzyme
MSLLPSTEVTDTMIAVDDMESALDFWTTALNMHLAESAPGWVLLEHPTTHQKITLFEGNIGTPWCVAVRADNLETAIVDLASHGATMSEMFESRGLRGALCHSPSGAPILLYVQAGDDD